ncbi:MAG: hypothetical protein NTY70_13010, partial [Burkholderiales bacterium]|nr:hypothetical protein [Burkholderiales bacterium]
KTAAQTFDMTRPEYNPPLAKAKLWYCLIQFTLCLQVGTHFLLSIDSLAPLPALAYAGWLLSVFFILGGLMEQRPVYRRLEQARLSLTLLIPIFSETWFSTLDLDLNLKLAIALYALLSLLALSRIFEKSK